MNAETLRNWIRQQQVDDGQRQRVCRLHQRQAAREPEITIEILKATTSFFAFTMRTGYALAVVAVWAKADVARGTSVCPLSSSAIARASGYRRQRAALVTRRRRTCCPSGGEFGRLHSATQAQTPARWDHHPWRGNTYVRGAARHIGATNIGVPITRTSALSRRSPTSSGRRAQGADARLRSTCGGPPVRYRT
jgi:transposase